jgi:predicted nucleic acid-binding protein
VRRVFVDTSAFYALANQREVNHVKALEIRARLIRERYSLYTTNYVIAETHALVLARTHRVFALQVLIDIDRSNTTVIRASEADDQRARDLLRRYDDKDFSLTDATSFAVMERLGLRQAFSFDSDFAQYGFGILTV